VTTGEADSLRLLLRSLSAGDRVSLARAITLIESRCPDQRLSARALIAALPPAGMAMRVGITRRPGRRQLNVHRCARLELTAAGHRVAAPAVDPSSSLSGGSILGDKTRMVGLAADLSAEEAAARLIGASD
jgi:LAO/AO transport system kinase